MGLDTSFDCWHGPYSAFMRWREALHAIIARRRGFATDSLDDAWSHGHYDDQTDPLNVLMNHSDCDGEIPAAVCGPMADALTGLLDDMPERAMYDYVRPATLRFIAGLREAAKANAPVEFR